MRSFLTLMRREARDVRAITIALAVIAPLAILAYEHFFAHYTYGHLTARYVVPGAVALYAAIVASDLVSAEVATRRVHALAALPTTLATIWKAKALFLVLATVAFTGWTYATTGGFYALFAHPSTTWAYFGSTTDALVTSMAALPLAFSVLFFSTLLPRGFAAALAGALALGAVTATVASIDYGAHEISRMHGEQIVVGVPVLVGLLFLVGSYVAFTRGPIHSGGALRKTALAFVVPLAVLVPGTTVALAAVRAHTSLEPGDADAQVDSIFPSPDGRFLALRVHKDGQKRRRIWVIDTNDGSVFEAQGSRLGNPAWDPDGTVRVWTMKNGNRDTVRWVDADTGDVRKTRSVEQIAAENQITTLRNVRDDQYTVPVGLLEADTAMHPRYERLPAWWTHRERRWDRKTKLWTTTVTWDGRTETLTGVGGAMLSPIPGCVVIGDEGRLVHRDLATGDDLVTVTGKGHMSGRLTADGRFLHVYERDGDLWHYSVVDGKTGAHVAGPWTLDVANGNHGQACYSLRGDVSDWVCIHGDDADTYLLNLTTSARLSFENGVWPPPLGHELPNGNVILAHDGRVQVVAPDGEILRSYLR